MSVTYQPKKESVHAHMDSLNGPKVPEEEKPLLDAVEKAALVSQCSFSMLPKRRRLAAQEVQEVLKRGSGGRSLHLSVKYLRSPSALRTAAVVPKSVAKKATERNRLRRAVYHALVPFSGKGTMIIFVQKIPSTPLIQTFSEELNELFRKYTH